MLGFDPLKTKVYSGAVQPMPAVKEGAASDAANDAAYSSIPIQPAAPKLTQEETEKGYDTASQFTVKTKAAAANEETKAGKTDTKAETPAAKPNTAANNNAAAGGTKSSAEIQKEIEKLEEAKAANYEKIDKTEKQIEELIKKAEKKIEEAAEKREKDINEYKEESKKEVRRQLQAYVEANKNGEGMTKEQLGANIQNALPDAPGLSGVMAAIIEADGIADEIGALAKGLKSLILDTQSIENQITNKQAEYDAAKAAEEAAKKKSCDPIGFGYDDETYNFIIDDGSFDETSDFLGSESHFAAMEALDTNSDGIVNIDELEAGNIKAVTDSGKVIDLREKFGSNFSVNLNFDKNGAYDSIDTSADDDGDGTVNQELLGTYSVNINNDTSVKGFVTDDDTDWLKNKFNLSSGSAASDVSPLNERLQNHIKKTERYENNASQIKEKASIEYKKLGLTKEELDMFKEVMEAEGRKNADNFFLKLNNTEEENKTEEPDNSIEDNTKDKFDKDFGSYMSKLDFAVSYKDINSIMDDCLNFITGSDLSFEDKLKAVNEAEKAYNKAMKKAEIYVSETGSKSDFEEKKKYMNGKISALKDELDPDKKQKQQQ